MHNDPGRLKTLFTKYTEGTNTPEETKLLFQLLADGEADEEVKALLQEELNATDIQDNYDKQRWDKVLSKINTETAGLEPARLTRRGRFGFAKIAVAASIVIAAGIGFYFYQQTGDKTTQTQQIAANDVAPGTNSATLTLSDGRKILLSNAVKGELAKEAGVSISKTADGQIIYEIKGDNTQPNKINTLATARGETYRVLLPDGTEAWLNAQSSLKYPASFAGANDRMVELAGEAYFEVAKDKAHPFRIKTATQEVTVLGTHFNINAYTDEPAVKTTLLEGSVEVEAASGKAVIIKPGQQASISGTVVKVENVETGEFVAWKDGDFWFDDEEIHSVMRKLSRWYNVDVQFEGPVTTTGFSGKVSRFKNISQVLKALEATKIIHFKVEGRRVIVTK